MDKWFYPKGALAHNEWECKVDSTIPGWTYTGLRIATVANEQKLRIEADKIERVIFILEGASLEVSFTHNATTSVELLAGRQSVFRGTVDHLYLPIDTEITISGNARFAIGEAPATQTFPVKIIKAQDVPVFIRGAGKDSREVHNFGMPDVLAADRLIVVEVIVPAGNSSGTPSHKHDTYLPGIESNLEEIYYFESKEAIFRGYSSDQREFDLTQTVGNGDVVLVPFGWHGPVSAKSGHDLYFFNVMAGPDPVREWNVTEHPDEVLTRQSWRTQLPDPRLPYLPDKK